MKRLARTCLATALVASMVLSATACKKKEDGKKTKKGAQQLVAENDPYFNVEEQKLDLPTDADKQVSSIDISRVKIANGTILTEYRISYIMPEDVQSEYTEAMNSWSVDTMQKIEDEYMPVGLAMFSLDGQCKADMRLSGATMINDSTIDSNGECLALAQTGAGTTFYRFSSEGNQETNWSLRGEYYSINQILGLPNGEVLLADETKVEKFNDAGESLGTFNLGVIGGKTVMAGDTVYVQTAVNEQTGEEHLCYIQELDTTQLTLKGEKKKVNADALESSSFSNGTSYISNLNGIEKVDIESNVRESLLAWSSTDVNYANMTRGALEVVSNDEIYVISTKYKKDLKTARFSSEVSVMHLTRAQSNPHAGKPYIEVASFGIPASDFVDYIVEYNLRADSMARVRLHDYSDEVEAGSGSKQDFVEKYYFELLSGNSADILCNFSEFSQFNTEDVLVDLNTFIDGDKGLNRDEYFDNVFRAFETDGKLFQIPVSFEVQGLLGNKELIGDRTGWTYSEFQDVVDQIPENVSAIDDMLYDELLDMLLSVNIDQYIDYGKKEVHFDSADFKQALEITKAYGLAVLPEPNPSNQVIVVDGEDLPDDFFGTSLYQERFEQRMLALTDTTVSDIEDYAEQTALCDGNAIVIGMPSPDGNGLAAAQRMSLAISAASPNQEAAWDFIRHMFDEEAQYQYVPSMEGIAMNRKAFEQITNERAEGINQEHQNMEDHPEQYFGMEPVPAVSDACKADYRSMVERVGTVQASDMSVMAVIQEEAAAYFAGQRTLDEVCKNIQDRTRTIVQERG